MGFLSRIIAVLSVGAGDPPPPVDEAMAARLSAGGWIDEKPSSGMRMWRRSDAVLSLAHSAPVDSLLKPSSDGALKAEARQLAQSRDGGLIEVETAGPRSRPLLTLIYKRLLRPAYVYTGMLIAGDQNPLVWTVVSGEQGTTGVREAIITAELLSSGEMTIEEYQRSWATDPYDPSYRGVDKTVLRFRSDDERYDARFPNHPLTRVRSILVELRDGVDGT